MSSILSKVSSAVFGDTFVAISHKAIHDTRLVVFFRLMQALVWFYVVVIQIVLSHRYAEFEVPLGYGNIWSGPQPEAPSIKPNHCDNPSYNWGLDFTAIETAITGGISFGPNISCSRYSNDIHSIVGDSSFTAVTAEWRQLSNGSGPRKFYFTDTPEQATFNMIHAMSASFLEEGLINVPVVVTSKTGEEIARFDKGAIVSGISIGTLLKAAGIVLDERNIQPWIRGGEPDQQPFFRATGVVLLVRVWYSNLRPWEMPSSGLGRPQAEITVERIPQAWGFIGTSEGYDASLGGEVVNFKTGVKVQFIFSGNVGELSLFELVMRLVEGAVLLDIALYITEKAAKWWLLRRGVFKHLTATVVTAEEVLEARHAAAAAAHARASAKAPSIITSAAPVSSSASQLTPTTVGLFFRKGTGSGGSRTHPGVATDGPVDG